MFPQEELVPWEQNPSAEIDCPKPDLKHETLQMAKSNISIAITLNRSKVIEFALDFCYTASLVYSHPTFTLQEHYLWLSHLRKPSSWLVYQYYGMPVLTLCACKRGF